MGYQKKIQLLVVYLFCSTVKAQFLPFAMFKTPAVVDPCSGTPALGTACAGGALYAGIFDGGKYMITPGNCTDSVTPTCNGATDTLNKRWIGSTGSTGDIVGVENVTSNVTPSSSSYRGHVNTPVIAADPLISSDSAADYCNDMVYGGHSDWYLPSKSELVYIYCHANISGGSHNTSYPQEDVDCVSYGGKTSELPGFAAQIYRSSTEYNGTYAWVQLFSSGFQGGSYGKSSSYRVRCIRRY